MRIPRPQGALAAILKTSSLDPEQRECGRSTAAQMAAKMAGASPGGERRPRVPDGQHDGKQRRRSATRPPPARPSSSGESAMDGNKGADTGEAFRHGFDHCNHCDWIWKGDACDMFYRELGADTGEAFRHGFDHCNHCDWIWKGDACDMFYRELAESQLESITYELASRPNPGLFARFFSEKGYQKGRATQESTPGGLDAIAASPPHGSTWASEADWRARISGLATHEKKAAGDFCCPAAGGGTFLEVQSATSSEEAWSGGGKKSRHISSQRSMDGFFKLFGRKK
ncbi:hypothetical protein HPB48_008671 [Haemaphysalis longicornis]|uniref:Uncharacterized protein n=1 Tax=Haemaphysalis longicornis TaxID=44386 RepID=A0A9J6FWK7_HAELO|nr:hypothetical protein HPB48_008671 [Haemaphysalis longicornis]